MEKTQKDKCIHMVCYEVKVETHEVLVIFVKSVSDGTNRVLIAEGPRIYGNDSIPLVTTVDAKTIQIWNVVRNNLILDCTLVFVSIDIFLVNFFLCFCYQESQWLPVFSNIIGLQCLDNIMIVHSEICGGFEAISTPHDAKC